MIGGCGKAAYTERSGAKKAARKYGGHLRPYRCEKCGQWHVGHLPPAVLYGQATADDVYRGNA